MKMLFTNHPKQMGETYCQHFFAATRFGLNMLRGGMACCLHAIFPFLFEHTASNLLFKMMHHFLSRLPKGDSRAKQLAQLLEEKA